MKIKSLLNSTGSLLKKSILAVTLLLAFFYNNNVSAQTVVTIGTATSTTSTSGLSSTTTAGDRNERHTCIYLASELTAAGMTTGSPLMSIAWEKTGAASYAGNNLTIRVWLKHNAAVTFPANPNFATETGTATMVYQTTSGTIPEAAGWLSFNFNTALFTWNGTDNIQVITELIRPASWTATGFLWRTIGTTTNGAANANGTTAAPPATLTRTGTRPQVRFEIAATGNDAALVSMPNPVSGAPGVQNIDVVLRNTGTTTLTTAGIGWTINGGASTNFPWAGSLIPGASTTVTIASPSFSIGTNIIQATVSNPNGGADQNPSNNVVSKTILTCAPLTGAYTINKGLPTAGVNFNSFKAFSDYLTACGISGNVTATVTAGSGPYNEQVIFQNISGIGPGARVTIEGNAETIVSDTAIIQTGGNPNRHIIKLADLIYFTINNLHVDMFPGSTGFIGIHILNSADNITVSNCVVNMGTGTSTLLGAIAATASESSLLTAGHFTNLNITGNTTMAGGYGVVIYGLSPATTANNVISNNNISGTNTNAIYVQQNNNLTITGNTVNFSASNGIQVAGPGNINTLVEKNFISCTNPTTTGTLRGIYIFGSSPANPNKVVNNVIMNMNAPAATVIGITNRTSGAEFYFNTIILDNAAATGTVAFGFEEDLSNLGSLLRDNIFYISRTSTSYSAALALASTSTVASTINSNNNVFYTENGAYVAARKGLVNTNPPNNIYANLTDWQPASGQDAASFQTDPNFQPGTAIPRSAVINGQGVTIAGITTDIMGITRTIPPDPGAYEFDPPTGDAAITNYILPAIPLCAATLDVQFELTNSGGNTLNSVTINWTVNGVPQAPVNWSGPPLASGASTIVTLGNIPLAPATFYDFSATSSNPNGGVDVNPVNDNFTYTGFRKGFDGIVTINSGAPASPTNYQSFQNMANALSQYGVCNAVTINVLNGPYTEQVVFNAIPGTSAVNTVTLNGNNQVLQYNPTLASNDHILQLNAVTHMTVENLTINSLHGTQGRGIHITNGASKLVIRNNIVNVSVTNSTSICFGIIISGVNWLLDGSQTDSVIISGNTVTGGYSSIQLSGIHWTNPLTRISVLNNTVLDWYGFGIYLSYTNNALIRGNTIRRPFRANSGSDAVTPAGITIPAGSLGFMLDKNRMYDFHLNMIGTTTISRGVYVSGTSTAPTSGTIQNNLIYGMQNEGAQYGIQQNSVNGPINIYHNTIVLNSPSGASTSNTNAINMSNFNPQFGTDIRNNIFVVTRGGTGVKRIFDVSASTSSFISNYNVSWLNAPGGTQTYGQIGSTTYNTFADWQGSGHDLNSSFVDPAFVNPPTGNFTPTAFFANGTFLGTSPVGAVVDDILGTIRGVNPDPGAFEFTPPPCALVSGGTASTTAGTLCASGTATLTATGFSTGAGSSYQWQYSNDNFVTNINDLVGQTNPSSASTGVITSTTYYRLRVICASGPATAYSNIVTVPVNQPVSITTQPLTQSVCTGASVTFTVVANNATAYQWQVGGVNIGGATSSTYTISSVALADAGNYTVIINGNSPCPPVTSNIAVLTVLQSVQISTQPVSQSVCAGGNVSFSVNAIGAGLTYQWRKGTVNIGGATSSTYSITGVTTADAGSYDVIVTGTCGPVTSAAATLTVNITGSWIGVTSTNWNTASNWCGGIPTPGTDVFIPSSAPFMPNLSVSNGTARNISISNGGSLTVGVGGILEIYGNLANSGTFNPSAGDLVFRGASSQSASPFTALNVIMNGAGGLVLNGNTSVTGNLLLNNGNISLGSFNLSLGGSSIGSVNAHIITNGTGNVIATNVATLNLRTIPVGINSTSYNPVSFSANPGHVTDNFTINVKQGVFVNGVSGTLYSNNIVDRTWNITEGTAGGSNVNVTLQWAATQELAGFQRNRAYVMQHNGTSWLPGPNTGASGADPYTKTLENVSSFSPFAVGSEALTKPITGIFPNPANREINIVMDMPANTPVVFTIYDATGRMMMRTEGSVVAGLSRTTLNIDRLSAGVYLLKVSTPGDTKFISERFVKIH